jgi:hypothetical protein
VVAFLTGALIYRNNAKDFEAKFNIASTALTYLEKRLPK